MVDKTGYRIPEEILKKAQGLWRLDYAIHGPDLGRPR